MDRMFPSKSQLYPHSKHARSNCGTPAIGCYSWMPCDSSEPSFLDASGRSLGRWPQLVNREQKLKKRAVPFLIGRTHILQVPQQQYLVLICLPSPDRLFLRKGIMQFDTTPLSLRPVSCNAAIKARKVFKIINFDKGTGRISSPRCYAKWLVHSAERRHAILQRRSGTHPCQVVRHCVRFEAQVSRLATIWRVGR